MGSSLRISLLVSLCVFAGCAVDSSSSSDIEFDPAAVGERSGDDEKRARHEELLARFDLTGEPKRAYDPAEIPRIHQELSNNMIALLQKKDGWHIVREISGIGTIYAPEGQGESFSGGVLIISTVPGSSAVRYTTGESATLRGDALLVSTNPFLVRSEGGGVTPLSPETKIILRSNGELTVVGPHKAE